MGLPGPYKQPVMKSSIGSPEAECSGHNAKGGKGVGTGSVDPARKMSGPIPPEDNIKSAKETGKGGRHR